MTRNHFFKPLSWRTQRLAVKNSFEIKSGRRVRIDSNIFENNWEAAQNGFMILFTVRANGTDDNNGRFGVIEDVTFTNNRLINTVHGINILGRDDVLNAGRAHRITIRNNVFEKVGGRLFQLLEGPANVVIDHNTSPTCDMTVMVTHSTPGFEMTNNLLCMGTYGLFGAGEGSGMRPVRTYLPGSKIEGNVFIGQPTAEYPANNVFTAAVSSVGFTDAVAGNYKLTAISPYRERRATGRIRVQDGSLRAVPKGGAQRDLRALLNSDAIVNRPASNRSCLPARG